MVKSSKETIMKDEQKILTLLEHSAKESIDELAKICGFSRQKVWRIIKHLEERKIIWGYTAITDEKIKDLKHFTALVKRNNEPFDSNIKKEMIFDKIDNYPQGLIQTENIYYTHGICDFIFTFYAPDIVAAKKFLDLSLVRLNKYIKDYTLIETLFPIRRQGLKNPKIKELAEYI
jgi:DNA-binding Lrp family transcriptional regulator